MRIAVIGAGSIGRRHHENLQSLGAEAQLLPWRGFDPGALAARRPDAVVIATATPIRLELVKLCRALDVPFYIEKPLAYDLETVEQILTTAGPLAPRCMVGFMMRYHAAFRHLAQADLASVYDAAFGIGHDVRQWRQNWRFAESYAAQANGGGVLLDLCHELDMACTLFPGLDLARVSCLGHPAFPGVDFATRITLAGPARLGSVAMDYLSPVSFRRITLRGTALVAELDLLTGQGTMTKGQGVRELSLAQDRNAMFLAAMRDFLHLVAGRPVSDVEHLPRLDLAAASCRTIARAWAARRFVGQVGGDFA